MKTVQICSGNCGECYRCQLKKLSNELSRVVSLFNETLTALTAACAVLITNDLEELFIDEAKKRGVRPMAIVEAKRMLQEYYQDRIGNPPYEVC